MKLQALTPLFVAIAAVITPSATANCNLRPTEKFSAGDGGMNFNDSDGVGGAHQIDKITKVEVWVGSYWGNKVVARIRTTYKLKNGDIKEVSNGKASSGWSKFTLNDGVYLKSVKMRVGKYVDWIQFCDTNGDCSSKFGGSTSKADNRHLHEDSGVIKYFLGKDGKVIDRVRVAFELNQIYSVKMKDREYNETNSELNDESLPDFRQVLDNLHGTVGQSQTITFKEAVETTETTRITKSQQYDVGLQVTTTGGIDVGFISAGVETTFSVGTSWSTSLEETSTKTLSKTMTKEFALNAPPGTVTTADIHFNMVHYAYKWQAPTVCTYTFDPFTEVQGDNFEGTMEGDQPFPEVRVVYSYRTASSSNAPTNDGIVSQSPEL